MHVRPRKKIDASFRDLFTAFRFCLTPSPYPSLWMDLDQFSKLSDRSQATMGLNCLSARSAFDLLLTALKLPVGSEVLMTAANIPDMFEIVRRHDLVPVTLDLDPVDFGIGKQELERKLSEKTELVLIAHLFGSRTDLKPILRHPRRNDFVLVEDCAQLFIRDYYRRRTESDFQLFSLGPIKTATALGGGVLCYQKVGSQGKESITGELLEIVNSYPVQSRFRYAKRVLKYVLIKCLTTRFIFPGFYRMLRDPDQTLGSLARNFKDTDLLEQLRVRPCSPLVRMMKRRIVRFNAREMQTRREVGNRLIRSVSKTYRIPGRANPDHRYWVFPITAKDRQGTIKCFREQGFDATAMHSMDAPNDDSSQLQRLFESILFVPLETDLREEELSKLVELIDSTE